MDKDIITAFQYLLGAGLPIILLVLAKDTIANIVAGIQIRMKTSFSLNNNFEIYGRKSCRIEEQRLTQITIIDINTRQRMRIFNRDFVRERVWENEIDGKKI
jgi:hypothetical protein